MARSDRECIDGAPGREIAAIETQILAGNPDLQSLCLALSDWSGELRILQNEQRRWKPSPRRREEQGWDAEKGPTIHLKHNVRF